MQASSFLPIGAREYGLENGVEILPSIRIFLGLAQNDIIRFFIIEFEHAQPGCDIFHMVLGERLHPSQQSDPVAANSFMFEFACVRLRGAREVMV